MTFLDLLAIMEEAAAALDWRGATECKMVLETGIQDAKAYLDAMGTPPSPEEQVEILKEHDQWLEMHGE